MRSLLWVLLLGLSALAAAQNEEPAIAQLAEVAAEAPVNNEEVQQAAQLEEEPAVETAAQGILEAVSAVVGSFKPNPPTVHTAAEEAPSTEASEAVSPEESPDSSAVETVEGNVASTEATVVETEPTEEVVEEVVLSKKEQKAIKTYNEATDKLLVVLSERLKSVEPFPLLVDEAALLALDKVDDPIPEEEEGNKGSTRNNKNKNKNKNKGKKNKKNKRKNKRKNRNDFELEEEEEEGRGKDKNNSNEKNNNRSNENDNNNKRKKNKNKNKNNKNRSKNNRKSVSRRNRNPKAMNDDEDDDDVEQGRRKGGRPINMREKSNKQSNNKNKRKQNKNANKGKNNKNKNRRNKNKGRTEIQSREEMGPVMPTTDERSASNARLTGLSAVSRDGDVIVDISGKKDKVEVHVVMGPLTVNLKEKSRALKKADVTTNIECDISLKFKNVNRRNKISLSNVEVTALTPEDVAVIRSDTDLQPDVISTAQEKVVSAIDTERIGRIISEQITEILAKDDVMETLENHPFLRQ